MMNNQLLFTICCVSLFSVDVVRQAEINNSEELQSAVEQLHQSGTDCDHHMVSAEGDDADSKPMLVGAAAEQNTPAAGSQNAGNDHVKELSGAAVRAPQSEEVGTSRSRPVHDASADIYAETGDDTVAETDMSNHTDKGTHAKLPNKERTEVESTGSTDSTPSGSNESITSIPIQSSSPTTDAANVKQEKAGCQKKEQYVVDLNSKPAGLNKDVLVEPKEKAIDKQIDSDEKIVENKEEPSPSVEDKREESNGTDQNQENQREEAEESDAKGGTMPEQSDANNKTHAQETDVKDNRMKDELDHKASNETTMGKPAIDKPQEPDGVDLSPHDMPAFDEWKKDFLEKGKKLEVVQRVYEPTADKQQVSDLDRKLRNYASSDCGAKVRYHNKEAQHPQYILNENKDEYMIQPCAARKWFIVEVCEPITVSQIEIGNLELFSSTFENFTVFISRSGSKEKPGKDWLPIGTFHAREERAIQSFLVDKVQLFTSFVKFEINTHHGHEHFCPITIIRLYGLSVDEDDDDDDVGGSETSQEAVSIPSPQADLLSAGSAAASFTANSTNYTKDSAAQDPFSLPTIPQECFKCFVSVGDVPLNCRCVYELPPQVTYCDITSTIIDNYTDISNLPDNSSAKLIRLEDSLPVGYTDNQTKDVNLASAEDHVDKLALVADRLEVKDRSGLSISLNTSSNGPLPADNIPVTTSGTTLEVPVPSAGPVDILASSDAKALDSVEAALQPSPPSPDHALNISALEQAAGELEDMNFWTTPPPPALRHSKRSAVMKLSNSLRALELNLTVTNRYLEEMSKKYKNQKEELQKALNSTMRNLLNTTKKLETLEKQYADLKELCSSVLVDVEQVKEQLQETHSMGLSTPFMLVAILMCLLVSCCRQPKTVQHEEIRRILEAMPETPRLHWQRRGSAEDAMWTKPAPAKATLKKCVSQAEISARNKCSLTNGRQISSMNGVSLHNGARFEGSAESAVNLVAYCQQEGPPDVSVLHKQQEQSYINGHIDGPEEFHIVSPAKWRTYDTPNRQEQLVKQKRKKTKSVKITNLQAECCNGHLPSAECMAPDH